MQQLQQLQQESKERDNEKEERIGPLMQQLRQLQQLQQETEERETESRKEVEETRKVSSRGCKMEKLVINLRSTRNCRRSTQLILRNGTIFSRYETRMVNEEA